MKIDHELAEQDIPKITVVLHLWKRKGTSKSTLDNRLNVAIEMKFCTELCPQEGVGVSHWQESFAYGRPRGWRGGKSLVVFLIMCARDAVSKPRALSSLVSTSQSLPFQ
jgi:hypothetical protein